MNDYRHIYPEIERRRRPAVYYVPGRGEVDVPADDRPVVFPDACPACGATKTSDTSGRSSWPEARYACGGSYTNKPQIQNHTDKWWGHCPVTKAAQGG